MHIVLAALLLKPYKSSDNQLSSIGDNSLYKPTPSVSG